MRQKPSGVRSIITRLTLLSDLVLVVFWLEISGEIMKYQMRYLIGLPPENEEDPYINVEQAI